MATLQTLIALVLLIFVLSVFVQAIQEVVKALLGTKATVMEATMKQFMGSHLTLDQVTTALAQRGMKIHFLENLDTKGFRELLDGVAFEGAQLQGLVGPGAAPEARVKDNIASAYEAARAAFQDAYTRRNKIFVLIISFVIVLLLNANIISLYQQITVDGIVQQTLVGQAAKVGPSPTGNAAQADLGQTYKQAQQQISQSLHDYPILVRTWKYCDDFKSSPPNTILGLLFMGILVSLGAPFWNDVLKGLMGVNNALNMQPKKP